jgi:AcrR family transcriptional regulator
VARRTWTRAPDDRRQQLLDAAMERFSAQGADVSVAEITRAAGVSKGTFYVYFESKAALVAALRAAVVGEYHVQMGKAILDNSPFESSVPSSHDVVRISVDFLSSDLHEILFPTAADQAQGQHEVIHGFEHYLRDANAKGITDVPDPYWFAVLLVGAANFAVQYALEAGTFDRNALVDAIVELQRRTLEL